ncbi:hypothetical protein STEG23_015221, partial [Scotinomys teguina]
MCFGLCTKWPLSDGKLQRRHTGRGEFNATFPTAFPLPLKLSSYNFPVKRRPGFAKMDSLPEDTSIELGQDPVHKGKTEAINDVTKETDPQQGRCRFLGR